MKHFVFERYEDIFGLIMSTVAIGDIFLASYSNDVREVFKTKYSVPILIVCSGVYSYANSYSKEFTILNPISSFSGLSYPNSFARRSYGQLKNLKLTKVGTVIGISLRDSSRYSVPKKELVMDEDTIKKLWEEWKKRVIDSGLFTSEDITTSPVEPIDFLGNLLQVGDTVIYSSVRIGSGLEKGTVTRISKTGNSVELNGSYYKDVKEVCKI